MEKIYCGNKQQLPDGYGRYGERDECLKCGYGSAMMQYKWSPPSNDPKPPGRAWKGCWRSAKRKKRKSRRHGKRRSKSRRHGRRRSKSRRHGKRRSKNRRKASSRSRRRSKSRRKASSRSRRRRSKRKSPSRRQINKWIEQEHERRYGSKMI
jgi:hypothetical protein